MVVESPLIANVYPPLPPLPETVPKVAVKVSEESWVPVVVMTLDPPVIRIGGLTVIVS